MNAWLAVFIGGGLGSLCRFLIGKYTVRFVHSDFPWATFISNMLACLILALALVLLKDKLQTQPIWRFFIITGFCGGFSTFSTFSYENFALFRSDNILIGLLNIIVSIAFGLIIMMMLYKEYKFE